MRAGSTATFHVAAWDAQGAPVVVSTGITWSAVNGAVTGSGSAVSQEFTAGNTATVGAVEAVQAVVGSATCRAKVVVLPATIPVGTMGVVVSDELSGRPIPNATTVLSVPSTGVELAQGVTDANGYVEVAYPGTNAALSVSVFHESYTYVTLVGYDASSASPNARLLAFSLRRNPVDRYGGYKGTFLNVPATVNVHAGIAGMSLPGALTELSLTQLLGNSTPTDIELPPISRARTSRCRRASSSVSVRARSSPATPRRGLLVPAPSLGPRRVRRWMRPRSPRAAVARARRGGCPGTCRRAICRWSRSPPKSLISARCSTS